MNRKGIILAGGAGTRLHPITLGTSKQLLNVYDKPMIYYPLSTLMLAGIRDILIIVNPHEIDQFQYLLKDGSQFGVNIQYAIQEKPDGLAQAFVIGKSFVNNCPSALILGDNIFYGNSLVENLSHINKKIDGATIFAYKVSDPKRFGIVEFDKDMNALSIEEKPNNPKSSYAVTGLYFYDNNVCEYASEIKPSKRGEYEITDLNNLYLEKNNLNVHLMNRGYAWLDTGTFDSLLEASMFISTIQNRQGVQISCPEEIAFKNGWISSNDILNSSGKVSKSSYERYLMSLLDE